MTEAEKLDIRWKQRFENFQHALLTLKDAIVLSKQRELSLLEKQGLIQSFEFVHELSWKVLKDFLETQGQTDIMGSKDTVRKAFNLGLIENGDVWIDMINSRNITSHTYNLETADNISDKIISIYFNEFLKLEQKLTKLQNE